MKYENIKIDNVNLFYRKAGNPENPAILLLHGFPSASHMFRKLIPILAEKYYVVAPDMPGFGQTQAPKRGQFEYTFENISHVMDKFTESIGLHKFAMYVFDYGAPVGFRLATWHPERITAIVSQNGNIYDEGLGQKWEARKKYWEAPTAEGRNLFSTAYAPDTIIGQYTFGTEPGEVSPDGYSLDIYYSLNKPDYAEIQNDLILDYRTNVALYPKFQEYLREYQPPLLAVWGKNDPSFIPAGALAFMKDLPKAEVALVNSGHFALESRAEEIGKLMITFLERCNPER
ncbi:MAG: alpha/beta hydrolase [Muribaculaceae bacterium]|nr:alpha/beta hydrolase [Muribaculaceae bacterium]